jgi:hypothetical protein
MKNQVSGSIAFDTEGLAAAAIAQVAEAISSIQQNLRTAIGLATGPLDDLAVRSVLRAHMPGDANPLVLADRLLEAGYVLVPASGAALAAELERRSLVVAPTFPTPEPNWLDRTED